MPTDTILTWADYADERVRAFALPKEHLGSYRAYLSFLYELNHGEPPPPVPETLEPTLVFVNIGRWLWKCRACGGVVPVEPDEPLICYQCGNGGWMLPAFPFNQESIEEELLRQPGQRLAAPIRNWRPGWMVAYLQERTEKANAAIAAGNPFPRSLSIGSTRAWAGGEILTAANMNTFLSDPIDDAAGRNGRVDFEDALRVKDGTNATTQPYLDLTQDYVGLPQRTSDPPSGAGRMVYRSDIDSFRFNRGGVWAAPPEYFDLLSSGQSLTPGVPVTLNLPAGQQFGSFRWLQAIFGIFDRAITDTITVPVALIPSGPFTSVLYMVDFDTDTLYTVDVTTGIATALPNPLGNPLGSPGGLASHGGILYVVNGANPTQLYTVDVTTGIATSLPNNTGIQNPTGLASHGGILYMVNGVNARLHTVDVTTGIATAFFNLIGTAAPRGLASHGGILYMVDDGENRLYTVDVTTGSATSLPNNFGAGAWTPGGLASHGGVLYVVDQGHDRLYTVDVTTGIATALPNVTGVTGPGGLASHGDDDGFILTPWVLIARQSATQVRILPLQTGYLHDLIGIG